MTRRDRVRKEVRRLLAATVVGLVAAVTAFLCAYYQHRDRWYDYGASITRHELDYIEAAVENHRRSTGRPPATLPELVVPQDQTRVPVEDKWRNPYQYRVEGDAFTLYSFGRDGREGGGGRDADIYPTSVVRRVAPPTPRQFVLDPESQGVRLTAVLAGVFAFLVCVLPPRAQNRPEFLARVAASAVAAVVFGVIVAALHVIPSGH